MDRPCCLCAKQCSDVGGSGVHTRIFCDNNTCQPFDSFAGRDDDEDGSEGVTKKKRKNKAEVNLLIVSVNHDDIEDAWEEQMWEENHTTEIKDTVILWESISEHELPDATTIDPGTTEAAKLPLECKFVNIFPFWKTMLIVDKFKVVDPREVYFNGFDDIEHEMAEIAISDKRLGTDTVGALAPLSLHEKVVAIYGIVLMGHIAEYYHANEKSGFTGRKRRGIIGVFMEVDFMTAAKIDRTIKSCVNDELTFVYDVTQDDFLVQFEPDAGSVVERITSLVKTIFQTVRSYHRTNIGAFGGVGSSNEVTIMRDFLKKIDESTTLDEALDLRQGDARKRDFINYMYVNSLVNKNPLIRNVILVVGSGHVPRLKSLFEKGDFHADKTTYDVTVLRTYEGPARYIEYSTFSISWRVSEWMDTKGIDKKRRLQYTALKSLAYELGLSKSEGRLHRHRDSRKSFVNVVEFSEEDEGEEEDGDVHMLAFVIVVTLTGYYYRLNGYVHTLGKCSREHGFRLDGPALARFAYNKGLVELIKEHELDPDKATDTPFFYDPVLDEEYVSYDSLNQIRKIAKEIHEGDPL